MAKPKGEQPMIRLNGHPHEFASGTINDDSSDMLFVVTLKDTGTGHNQTLGFTWSVLKAFALDEDLTGQTVRFNGHDHTIVGQTKKKGFINFGLKDAATDHLSALEVHKDLLGWREKVQGVITFVDWALKLGGSLPARAKAALTALMTDPYKKE